MLIVGGGIAGLATALAFARRGFSPLLLEQHDTVAEIGAGIQITPNGMAVLRALGLGEAAAAAGLAGQALEVCDALSGRCAARFPLPGGGNWLFLHRAALIALLYRAACGAGVAIRTAARVERLEGGKAVLTGGERIGAGLILGADGLHSVVRRHLVGGSDPFFTGQVAWRALLPALQDPAPPMPAARIWMAPGRHVVTYPLRDGRVNLVAVRAQSAWSDDGWHHRDDPEVLRRAFADLCPELRALLDRVTEVGRWGLFRHPVPLRWHDARTAILGDAAHPTLPFLAQGANLALEDAWVLAREVARGGRLDEALARYQAQRRPRVERAIAAANANARHYHLSGLPRRAALAGLSLAGRIAPAAFMNRYRWLHDLDVTRGG
nr:FAD-dependent oxidoreductase [Rubellimicrobium thermophilum]